MKYCEWFQHIVGRDEEFARKFLNTDDAQFNLNGSVNRHICVYWAHKNLTVVCSEQCAVCSSLSVRDLIDPFCLKVP